MLIFGNEIAGSGGDGGGGSGGSYSINAFISDTKTYPTAASASIAFNSDGTTSVAGGGSHAGPWFAGAPSAGLGSSVWVKFHLTSGVAWNTGIVADAVVSLASAQTLFWSIAASTLFVKNASVAVTFYSDAGGTNQIGTGTITVDVEETS